MNQLLALLTGKRVAIVGNAPLDRDYSQEINSADVVCRFNHFYNIRSDLAGVKTDIVFQTFAKPWYDLDNEGRNQGVLIGMQPLLYIAKKPQQFTEEARDWFEGKCKRIEVLSLELEKYARYTTGGAVLCYLAENLRNAEVKVYGFDRDTKWDEYIKGDAKHYAPTANEERFVVKGAIAQLESLTIGEPVDWQTRIVIPVKRTSQGAPEKNKVLLPMLLERIKDWGYPITVVTDDRDLCLPEGISKYTVPIIPPLADVTATLRQWRDGSGYFGDVILLQCTSPNVKREWLTEALAVREKSNIVVTAVKLPYKVNSIFATENGRGMRATHYGAPTVPRQKLPEAWRLSGALFLFPSDYLSRTSFFDNAEVTPIFIPEADAVDVDSVEQLKEVAENV